MLTAHTTATQTGPMVKPFMPSPDLRVLGAEHVAFRHHLKHRPRQNGWPRHGRPRAADAFRVLIGLCSHGPDAVTVQRASVKPRCASRHG